MRIHLASIRQFYPTAPILISKKGNVESDVEEMEGYRTEFGVAYWIEDCNYVDAFLRLLERCNTEYACIADHDVVLLSSLDPFLEGLNKGLWDLVGIEERIREVPGIDWKQLAPLYNGWMRFAPGYTDSNFLLFNWRKFFRQWGLRGIRGKRPSGMWDFEYHYGICQKLKRHKYLLPFHSRSYGLGNLLKDGDTNVLWHQWYGSYQKRYAPNEQDASTPMIQASLAIIAKGEESFLRDYPNLDLSDLSPAWGPGWDLAAEHVAAARGYPGFLARIGPRLRQLHKRGWRGVASRLLTRIERWRRLLFHTRNGP